MARTAGTLNDVTATVDPDRAEVLDSDVISLTIPAAMRFVRLVRIAVASIGRRRGLSVRAIDDLRLAVDEAFSLLLGDVDHPGAVDVTLEVDEYELLVSIVQRLDNGPVGCPPDDLVRFEVIISELVDRFDADPSVGVVQFSKHLS